MSHHYRTITYLGVLCGIILCILLIGIVVHKTRMQERAEEVPDFSSFQVGKERKEAFIAFLLPHVETALSSTRADKVRLEMLYSHFLNGEELERSDIRWLHVQAKSMRLSEREHLDMQFFFDLRRRMDVVPPSLILAQAAIETGWGTSRFFVQGLSLFGQQCYVKGCGILPKRRSKGAKHEVMRFNTPKDAIMAYLSNINAHSIYAKLRYLRLHKRMTGQKLYGQDLVTGLDKYSEIGEEYGSRITQVIGQNGLAKYDQMIEDVHQTIMEKGYY